MRIRNSNERIDERELNITELYALSALLKTASKEREKYLITLFNDGGESLEKYEKCFLINYVAKGRSRNLIDDNYGLYVTDSGKKLILSSEEVKTGDYKLDDSSNSAIIIPVLEKLGYKFLQINGSSRNTTLIMPDLEMGIEFLKTEKSPIKISTIVSDLEKLGFKFLETEESLLAFCSERNIVFWVQSIEDFNRYHNTGRVRYFQQPRVTNDGKKVVSWYSKVNDCNEDKADFPLFKDGIGSYLWLYDRRKDKSVGSVFDSSMKRIAQYPELYHAVGSENQVIIDKIILSELYPKLDEIYYNNDVSLNSKRLYMMQIVREQYGGDSKKAEELLSTLYDFQIRNADVRNVKSR